MRTRTLNNKIPKVGDYALLIFPRKYKYFFGLSSAFDLITVKIKAVNYHDNALIEDTISFEFANFGDDYLSFPIANILLLK